MFAQRKTAKKPLLRLSHTALGWVGFALTAAGTIGTTVIQGGILKLEAYNTTAELAALIEPGTAAFAVVGWAVACFALGTLALPIYAMLLVEGVRRTASIKRYFARMLAYAFVCEVPYDLAYSGRAFELTSQNPLFGYCICLGMLYLLDKFENAYATSRGAGFQLWLIKAAIVVGAGFWAVLSQSLLGIYFVALCAVFWFFGTPGCYDGIYTLISAVVASLLRFPAPFGLFFVHWYDPEKGRGSAPRGLFYGLYPALLALCALARWLI